MLTEVLKTKMIIKGRENQSPTWAGSNGAIA